MVNEQVHKNYLKRSR